MPQRSLFQLPLTQDLHRSRVGQPFRLYSIMLPRSYMKISSDPSRICSALIQPPPGESPHDPHPTRLHSQRIPFESEQENLLCPVPGRIVPRYNLLLEVPCWTTTRPRISPIMFLSSKTGLTTESFVGIQNLPIVFPRSPSLRRGCWTAVKS